MEYVLIPLAAILTSGLTLFSGFGLGTLLMPVFAIFFPVDVAVALTAIVHFLNNLFKLGLLGKHANRRVVIRFGVPALLASFAGAQALLWLSGLAPLTHYSLLSRDIQVMPVKLVVAVLILLFAALELVPVFERASVLMKHFVLGGILSGFFGGLSGHQGALRSAFLVRSGLSREEFIATGVVIACLVDVSRLSVYFAHLSLAGAGSNAPLLVVATASAFAGAFIGNRLSKKVTMGTIRALVSIMLVGIALALGSGII